MDNHFPKLKIIKIRDILFHEEADPKRIEGLVQKFQKNGILINPVIVVEKRKEYILLDGANRISAFKALNYGDVLVQIVDYKRVRLKTWQQVVCNLDQDDLKKQVSDLIKKKGGKPKLQKISSKIRSLSRDFLSWVIFGQEGYKIKKEDNFSENLLFLNELTKLYKGQAMIYRIEPEIEINEIKCNYKNFTALIKFPLFTQQDVLKAASSEIKLPSGLTRHILPERALYVSLPLTLLKSKKSLKLKNQKLRQFLQGKVRNNQVRFYGEPVWIFDE